MAVVISAILKLACKREHRKLWVYGCDLKVRVAFGSDPAFFRSEAMAWIARVRKLHQRLRIRSRLSDDGVESFLSMVDGSLSSWLKMDALRHLVNEHHADLADLEFKLQYRPGPTLRKWLA